MSLDLFKIFSDASRLRVLNILDKKELAVCQIMGVLGLSQPLVSRNLFLLQSAGFIEYRREGKLMYYRLKQELPMKQGLLVDMFRTVTYGEPIFKKDMDSLKACGRFQKKAGKCNMETLKAFIEYRRKKLGRLKK
jgi:ArsR family transcriptional regulator